MMKTLDSPRKAGRPRSAEADVAILQAVLDLLATTGLTQLSMDAVASRAGVGKATIYRRWRSKEALVVDAWRTLIEPVATPDTGSLRGDIETIVDGIVEKCETSGFDVLSQITAAARTDPALNDALRDFVATRRRPMLEMLRRGVERGELRPDIDLGLLYDALVGPLFYRLLLTQDDIDRDVARGVIDIVLAGNTPT
jgi:AcrR family transcriptional regulator